MTVPTITALPAFPVRGEDPITFAEKANDSVAAYPTMVTQMNTMGEFVEDEAAAAEASRIAAEAAETGAEAQVALAAAQVVLAEAAADAAEAASNAEQWVSGQAYVTGDVVWSPINYLSYRANTNTSGTTDPSLSANWTILGIALPVSVANGGTGITSFGTGVATALGVNTNSVGGLVTANGSATLTNKRIDPRVVSAASASTLTPDISAADQYAYTALAAGLTINAPTGTPIDGNKLIFRLLDNGTARGLTWNGTYTVIGVTLPTTTVINKTTYVGCIYNANNTRWDVIAVTTQV